MKVGSLVREELHITPRPGREKRIEYRTGVVIEVDQFKLPTKGEIDELIEDWLGSMGPRVQVYWSDCLTTVQPGSSLEVLN